MVDHGPLTSMTAPKRICVDLDHTLATPDGPRIGEPYPGARFFLQLLKAAGLQIVIHTARIDPWLPAPAQLNMVIGWLRKHEMPYDAVCGKPEAIAYIDDRALAMPARPQASDYDRVVRDVEAKFFRQRNPPWHESESSDAE